jgi:hypothetical protein
MIPAPAPRLRPTAEFLLEEVRELETKIAQLRADPLQLLAAVYDLKNVALALMTKAIRDVACGRLTVQEIAAVVETFTVEDPRPIDVATSALAAARTLVTLAYGRRRESMPCSCKGGVKVEQWAVSRMTRQTAEPCT